MEGELTQQRHAKYCAATVTPIMALSNRVFMSCISSCSNPRVLATLCGKHSPTCSARHPTHLMFCLLQKNKCQQTTVYRQTSKMRHSCGALASPHRPEQGLDQTANLAEHCIDARRTPKGVLLTNHRCSRCSGSCRTAVPAAGGARRRTRGRRLTRSSSLGRPGSCARGRWTTMIDTERTAPPPWPAGDSRCSL